MKKIGILTFHRAFSYGGVLQAYALQNFLLKNNIDNEIVDYHCDYMEKYYQKILRKTTGNKLRGFVWSVLTAKDIIKSKKIYPVFAQKYLRLSCPYNRENISQTKDEYSKFIVGSDQVWSPSCVGFDSVYFLDFANAHQKYSYSASIAVEKIPQELEREYIKRLSDFQSFSLRENSGKKIVSQLLNRQGEVHIDPTLLLKKEDWDKIASKNNEKQPYILLFTVLKPKKLIDYARELSKKSGLKIIYLNNQSPIKAKGIEYRDPVSPNEFITLIKNAEYVCTNSFHGTAFSLIYEKKFAVETQTNVGVNIRAQELLERLDMRCRILSDSNFDIQKMSEWEKARAILEKEREKAESYLLSIN